MKCERKVVVASGVMRKRCVRSSGRRRMRTLPTRRKRRQTSHACGSWWPGVGVRVTVRVGDWVVG